MPPRFNRNKASKANKTDSEDDFTSDEADEGVDDNIFRVPEILPNYHWKRTPLSDLVAGVETECLDLNPEYQRDVVWDAARKTKLINSLLSGYYVPPVIFNVVNTSDDEKKPCNIRRCIDGKQRITSIIEFVKGKIPCTDDKGRRWYFMDADSRSSKSADGSKRILDVVIRKRFMRSELLTTEYSELTRAQEEDLFSRVQLGMPLTPAEKLRATSGEWQDLVRAISNKYPVVISLTNEKRARGFQLLIIIFKQLLEDSAGGTIALTVGVTSLQNFTIRSKITPEFKTNTFNIFKRYEKLAKCFPDVFKPNNCYPHTKTFSPIEFMGVALMLSRCPGRNILTLSHDIEKLRKYIRKECQDLRTNGRTWKVIIRFIDSIEEVEEDKEEAGEEEPIARSWKNIGASDGAIDLTKMTKRLNYISQDDTGQKKPKLNLITPDVTKRSLRVSASAPERRIKENTVTRSNPKGRRETRSEIVSVREKINTLPEKRRSGGLLRFKGEKETRKKGYDDDDDWYSR